MNYSKIFRFYFMSKNSICKKEILKNCIRRCKDTLMDTNALMRVLCFYLNKMIV
jgi:hypothetical protein